MFILCGLILEAGEILFRDFWSPFSFPFVFFLSVTIFKNKYNRPNGSCLTRTLGPAGFISWGGPAGPPQTLAALAPRRAAVRRTAGGSFFFFSPRFFFEKPFGFSDGFVCFFLFRFFKIDQFFRFI